MSMKKIYRVMDRILDPLPKEIREKRDKELEVVLYDLQDEDYKRYKHRCYRNLLISIPVSLLLGKLFSLLLKLL